MFWISNFLLLSCIALFSSTLSFSFHRWPPILLPPALSSQLQNLSTRELVSQSALSVFDDSKCMDAEFRGNRTRVRDVTLAVITISILRFEPPRIARWRVRDGSNMRIQTRMSAASGVSIMRTAAKRALSKIARVGIFALYAAKLQYVPHCKTSCEQYLDKTQYDYRGRYRQVKKE